jgi:molecular chaperone HtpG
MSSETFPFRAEVQQLLDLMIHSLYSDKEIFLRELVSNASDALDRLRFEALTRPELLSEGETLEIRLAVDKTARTLTVHDTGIGMSRQELIDHIGTIAKSGTRDLAEKLRKSKAKSSGDAGGTADLGDLIGQFGVGFYSSFMVADRVVLVTRRAGEEGATRWESEGAGEFKVEPSERDSHGTSVTLHLKPVDPIDEEEGIEDFTEVNALERLVRRYSDFIAYPIVLDGKTLNSMKPIWERPASDVKPEEHAEFYKHISHDFRDPLLTISQRAEGLLEYRALLFVPPEAPFDLFYVGYESGLRLYVRRVLIVDKSPDLLPRYLRFLTGVVDSPDLPLNVSREMLQHDRQIRQIRKALVKKVLDSFAELKEKEPEKYATLFKTFGRVLKEGPSEDFENKEKIADLLLFQSSHHEENLTTLSEYAARMKEGQEAIFYLTGASRASIESSPHLEAFRAKGIEVLYLTDAVDELVVESVAEYEGKKLRSAGKGTVDLGTAEEKEEKKKELDEKSQTYKTLLDRIQTLLDDRIKEVRLSGRLTDSPACLVGAEHDFSPRLEQLLKRDTDRPRQKRILELNPDHEIVGKLEKMAASDSPNEELAEYAELLYGYAVLAEGSELPDPAGFARRVAELMTRRLS